MTLAGILLGLLNIAIVVAILVLIGAIIVLFASWMNFTITEQVKKGYMVVVALIGLYMIVALLLGIPTVHIIHVGDLMFRNRKTGNTYLLVMLIVFMFVILMLML